MERLTLDEAIKYIKEVVQKNRKNKEKNTIVIPNSFISSADCAEKYEQVAEWSEELKSYKEAEEHGLLVKLPDDLHRTLYQINYEYTECTEYGEEKNKCEIYNCEYDCDSRKEYYISKVDLQYILIGRYYNRLGKTLFLTREEAEKEVKGNEE